tara:strand:- start:121 stop:324 length:204 start_codon:yes stop_codon:yes gene_type:complete
MNKERFDYNKFGHMTKEELLELLYNNVLGTGVTYKLIDPDLDGDSLSVIFSFNNNKETNENQTELPL